MAAIGGLTGRRSKRPAWVVKPRSDRVSRATYAPWEASATHARLAGTTAWAPGDHPRNHALIAVTDKWELSPASGLTPNPLTSLEKRDLAMTCETFNRYANRINFLSTHGQFKLSLDGTITIIDDIQ